jgi:hypothetical protein
VTNYQHEYDRLKARFMDFDDEFGDPAKTPGAVGFATFLCDLLDAASADLVTVDRDTYGEDTLLLSAVRQLGPTDPELELKERFFRRMNDNSGVASGSNSIPPSS